MTKEEIASISYNSIFIYSDTEYGDWYFQVSEISTEYCKVVCILAPTAANTDVYIRIGGKSQLYTGTLEEDSFKLISK